MRINPFRPNSPVTVGMFVGRIQEVNTLEAALFQTRAGQPKHVLITGERGIGKTSLLTYLDYIGRGDVSVEESRFNYLVIQTDLSVDTSQLGLARKLELGFRQSSDRSENARAFFEDAWNFLRRLEAFGVKLREDVSTPDDEAMLEEFSYSFAHTVEKVIGGPASTNPFSHQYDGVLVLIDECDNASPKVNLGAFLKLLLERLQRHGCERVMFVLAGLPDVRDVLRESHPSSLRLFDELVLDRLQDEEVKAVINYSIEEANKINPQKTSIELAAVELLVQYSEGYPHFIQQFGYSAFAADTDFRISTADVESGAHGKNGAIRLIGDRYYRDSFYNKIQGENYRQVLRIMAEKLDAWISKEEIRKTFSGKETILTNALKALTDRHIIVAKEGTRGIYRLQQKGFALWIKYYAQSLEANGGEEED